MVDFTLGDLDDDGDVDGGTSILVGPSKTIELKFQKKLLVAIVDDALMTISDFVQIRGGFAFTRQPDTTITLIDGSTKNVVVTTIGFDKLSIFVGNGPYFVDSDGDNDVDDDDTPSSDALGLLLKDVTIAIALFKPTDTADKSRYHAVSASAQELVLLGFETIGNTISASGYHLEINGGKDGTDPNAKPAVDFTKLTDEKLTVETGGGTVDFEFDLALLRVSIDRATLKIEDFIYASGGLSFTLQPSLMVTLNDPAETEREVKVFAFEARNVDLFVGSGPYFIDSDSDGDIDGFDVRGGDAVGLAMENVNFAFLLMKPTDPSLKSIKYLTLKASAERVALVGVDFLDLPEVGIEVGYNAVKNSSVPERANA